MYRQQGVGLVEVMLAMLLIAVMAATLLPLSQRQLKMHRDARYWEVALGLAESRLEELRHLAQQHQPQLLISGEVETQRMHTFFTVSWTVNTYRWHLSQNGWQISSTPLAVGNKHQLKVTVVWQDSQAQTQSISLHTAAVALPTLSQGPFGLRSAVM